LEGEYADKRDQKEDEHAKEIEKFRIDGAQTYARTKI